MTHPDQDTLVDVALGSPAPAAVTEHVRSCARCAAEVAELQATVRAVRDGADEVLVEPPASVWAAVLSDLDRDGSAPPGAVRRWSRGLVAAACAAGITLGSLVTYALTRPDPAPAPVRLASAELTPLDSRAQVGEADLVSLDATMTLQVRTEPLDPQGGYLEIWLINRDAKRMVSIGMLPPGTAATALPVTRQLIDQGYVVVDISREAFDDRPEHSGVSLARGTLDLTAGAR